ncbi:MAG: 50S ribosomal protein L18 [Candidatus Vogelbacteria bacterium]|nr:50S ribosomal protein L18 [Candidatus Vogelbacteria bacterium]
MKNLTHLRRQKRIRSKISGTADRPRLAVFRSGKYIYAQIIDDQVGQTLVAVRDQEKSASGRRAEDVGFIKVARAFEAGERLAKAALAKQIKKVAFDRSGYAYKGRVRALAEGARAGGLEF